VQQLIQHAGLKFMQFDAMRSAGPSEWMKVAAISSANGIPMAPHHGPAMHAHLVSAAPNGLMVEVFADPADYEGSEALQWMRWDKQREAFATYPAIRNGKMLLSELPGWGVELDEDALADREVRLQ
jgi:L-alanine-DL-glutamate epimerase-like enolase superfamily enzyme